MQKTRLLIFAAFLIAFQPVAYAAEFSNQDNPYIRAETEEDLLIGGTEEWSEDDFEYGMQSISDYYAVVGEQNELVYYYHYPFQPESILPESGLYANSANHVPAYRIPSPSGGWFQSLVSKDGHSVCLISEQVIDWNADPETVVLTMYADGEEQWHVCLKDLNFQQADYEPVYGEYEKWYGSLSFDASQIILTSGNNQKKRRIDRRTGKIAETAPDTGRYLIPVSVAAFAAACIITGILLRIFRKRKDRSASA